jgi:hypothetical protein
MMEVEEAFDIELEHSETQKAFVGKPMTVRTVGALVRGA